MKFINKQSWIFAASIALLVITCASTVVWAQSLAAVGSSNYFWLVKQDSAKKNITIYQRKVNDATNQLQKVATLTGELAKNGIAASNNELSLVYKNGNVQKVRIITNKDEPDNTPKYKFDIKAPIYKKPKKIELKSFANIDGHLWALVKVTNKKADKKTNIESIESIESLNSLKSSQFKEAELSRALGLPPAVLPDSLEKKSSNAPSTQTSAEVDKTKTETKLIKLSAGKWGDVGLPSDWKPKSKAWLVDSHLSNVPVLIAQSDAGENNSLVIYHYKKTGQWQGQKVKLPGNRAVVPLFVDNQLVIGQRTGVDKSKKKQNGISINLYVFRSGNLTKIGKLTLEKIPKNSLWTLLADNLSVALVAGSKESLDKSPLAWFTSMDLRGQVTQKATKLNKQATKPKPPKTDEYIVWIIVIAMALFMIFVFWKRDLRKQEAKLDKDTALGSLGRRAAAGFIDLAPIVLIVCYVFNIGPVKLFSSRWPGQEGVRSLVAMAAGLWVIGGFVVYSAIGELIFQKTLGKWITGLWVADLEGKKPVWWKIVLRCLLKALDLVAWILLLFPGLNPLRQRLGDMVAGTIVVMKKKK